jgi:hypothetical protein
MTNVDTKGHKLEKRGVDKLNTVVRLLMTDVRGYRNFSFVRLRKYWGLRNSGPRL